MNCQIVSVLLCLIAVTTALNYDRVRRSATDEDFGVIQVTTPEAEVEEDPHQGSERPHSGRPGIFAGHTPFFHNIFGNGGSVFNNRRPQLDFGSLLGFMEDQLKKIQEEMKFLLDAEKDPEVVSGLPDDYSNTTSTTKIVNGNEVTVNETIQKIGGNDSNSFFHFKVISIRPAQKTPTEEPEAVVTEAPEEFNVEDNEIPTSRRLRRQVEREYEFVPLNEDDETQTSIYETRRPSFNPFASNDFNPFSVFFGRPERRRPTVSQRPSFFGGFQHPFFQNQRPAFNNFPRLPSLFGHDEDQDQNETEVTRRPGVFNSFNLGDLFNVMEDQITQLGKEVNVMLNQFGNSPGLLPDNFDNTTSTTQVINGTTVTVNETVHKSQGPFGNSFIHIKVISFGPKAPNVTVEVTPEVTTPKPGPQETTPEDKKKPEAATKETNEIPNVDNISEEPENNPLPTDDPSENEITGKFQVRNEPRL